MSKRAHKASVYLVAAVFLLGACNTGADTTVETNGGAAEEAPEVESLTVGVIPVMDLAQVHVAEKRGYFEEAGINIDMVEMAGGAAMLPAIEAGDIDIGWGPAVTLLQAQEQGFDFRYVSGGAFFTEGRWMTEYGCNPESGVESASDLAGKRFGVNVVGSVADIAFSKWLQEEGGITRDDVEVVEIGFPDMPSAIEEGLIDCGHLLDPFVTIAKRTTDVEIIDDKPFSVIGDAPIVAGYFAQSDWIDDNPNTVDAFRSAIARATDDIQEDDAVARDLIPEFTPVEEDLAQEVMVSQFAVDVTEEDIRVWLEAGRELGMISEDADPAAIATP